MAMVTNLRTGHSGLLTPQGSASGTSTVAVTDGDRLSSCLARPVGLQLSSGWFGGNSGSLSYTKHIYIYVYIYIYMYIYMYLYIYIRIYLQAYITYLYLYRLKNRANATTLNMLPECGHASGLRRWWRTQSATLPQSSRCSWLHIPMLAFWMFAFWSHVRIRTWVLAALESRRSLWYINKKDRKRIPEIK